MTSSAAAVWKLYLPGVEKVHHQGVAVPEGVVGAAGVMDDGLDGQVLVVEALAAEDLVVVMIGQPHVGVDVVGRPVLVPVVVRVGQHLVGDLVKGVLLDGAVLGLVHQPVFAAAIIRGQFEFFAVDADAGADGQRLGLDVRIGEQDLAAAGVDDADHVERFPARQVDAVGQAQVVVADRVDDQLGPAAGHVESRSSRERRKKSAACSPLSPGRRSSRRHVKYSPSISCRMPFCTCWMISPPITSSPA